MPTYRMIYVGQHEDQHDGVANLYTYKNLLQTIAYNERISGLRTITKMYAEKQNVLAIGELGSIGCQVNEK